MADKNTRVGRERIGRPVDELVTGRSPAGGDRPGDTTTGELAGQTPAVGTMGTNPAGAAAPAPRRTTAPTPTGREPRSSSPDPRTSELRAEIEQTREEMSETVNEIQNRLHPRNLASNAADSIKETAAERTRDIVESEPVQYVRANPIPTAMIGVGIAGLAWLAFGGREASHVRHRSRYARGWREPGYYGPGYYGDDAYRRQSLPARDDYDHGAYGSYESTARRGEQYASQLADRAGDMADQVRHTADDVTRRARAQARRAQHGLERTWQESPLLIGAASAVLGALVGLSVPETEVENEWMGESRDQMIEGVQQTVRDKVEDVQHAATKAVDQVKDAVGLSEGEEGKG
jgi:ElaB/YqjD/DUF883 family membrane-anchored ribosome-binding protein